MSFLSVPEFLRRNLAFMVTLEDTTVIHAPIERCFDLARSVEVHLAGSVHSGESAIASGGVSSGLIGPGQRVTWHAKHFGVWLKLTSEVTAMDRPASFQDTMVQGIFRFMQHDHFFRPLAGDRTEMKDVFRFASPIPGLGRLAEIFVLERYMHSLLTQRNAVIKEIAESNDWPAYLGNWEAMIDLNSCRKRGHC